MAGGHATHSGISFQDNVAAWFAVHALANEPVIELGLREGIKPKVVDLETTAPVDDILVTTSDNGRCFINVKKTVAMSANPESQLGSVIDQFIRQWLACRSSKGERGWDKPVDRAKDRFVLAVGTHRTKSFAAATRGILSRISDKRQIEPREDIAKVAGERKAYDVLLNLIGLFWHRHTGEEVRDEDVIALLCVVRVVDFDFDGPAKLSALSLLRSGVVADPRNAEGAWNRLVAVCADFAERRSGGDQFSLRRALRDSRIPLKGIPEFGDDIIRLKAFTRRTLTQLKHLARLRNPDTDRLPEIVIKRRCTEIIQDCCDRESFLLIGEAGAGKSGALYEAATSLIERGRSVIVIAVDQHPVSTLPALERDLGLQHSLLDVLGAWADVEPGVLLIDALDATRGGPAEGVFQDLIRGVITEVPEWRVVASIRSFDLRFGVIYRDLFSGSLEQAEFCSSDFREVKHLSIPRLATDELEQVWFASSRMRDVYEQGSEALRDLLNSPFNLFLLATILSAGGTADDIYDVSTQIQLLDLYWSHRVIGSDQRHDDREEVLREVANLMVEGRRLSVLKNHLAAGRAEHLDRLLRDGVLSPSRSRGDHVHEVSFSHHMLFDYSVARLVLGGGHAHDFTTRLTTSDDHALLLAPAAMMALRMLWQEDDIDKDAFWTTAFAVAEAPGVGAFSRMLPGRIAAELVKSSTDFDLITRCLSKKSCKHRKSAIFLVRHCFGALLADVLPEDLIIGVKAGPWCKIVRTLASISISDLQWPFKAVIGQWTAKLDLLTDDQKADLNEAARRLLAHAISDSEDAESHRYDPGAIVSGIEGVARTVESAPSKSAEILQTLLSPKRVLERGHQELFHMAQQFDHLLACVPEVLAALYHAAYGTPLPSRDEVSSIGSSRILPLLSNKRQDFDMVRYHLGSRFARFVESYPLLATDVLIAAVDFRVREEKQQHGEVLRFAFRNTNAAYTSDYSGIWWSHSDQERDSSDTEKLLDEYVTGLGRSAGLHSPDTIKEVIDRIADRNQWASVWTAVMIAGSQEPRKLGVLLFPLLVVPEIISDIDARKPAGDLLSKVHPELSKEKKRDVELAILAVDSEETQRILLGCLKPADIVTQETRERRATHESEGPLPKNIPPFSIKTGWGKSDDDWWLKDKGVDLSDNLNDSINQAAKAVADLRSPDGVAKQKHEFHTKHWGSVVGLFGQLTQYPDIPEALRMKGWDALASAAHRIAGDCESPSDLKKYPQLEEFILAALDETLWPLPERDLENEGSFEESPSWGSPAPRIEAASALIALARAKREPCPSISARIEALAFDPSVAVRHQISSRVNMIQDTDPALMWRLCDRIISSESNRAVLGFFVNAFVRAFHLDPEWATIRLVELDDRVQGDGDEKSRDFKNSLVSALLRLWIVYDQPAAGHRIEQWFSDPINNSNRVLSALGRLRDTIVQGDPKNPTDLDERARKHAVGLFSSAISKSASLLDDFNNRWADADEHDRKAAETAIHIANHAATEIYFGSGAYDERKEQKQINEELATTTDSTRERFVKEFGPTLRVLAGIGHPSVTHYLLQTLEVFVPVDPVWVFRLMVRALIEGGRSGGYQYESLGANLFVGMVRLYLADYRWVLIDEPEFRGDLIKVLDIFVDVGWPEARRLVYELPEMAVSSRPTFVIWPMKTSTSARPESVSNTTTATRRKG